MQLRKLVELFKCKEFSQHTGLDLGVQIVQDSGHLDWMRQTNASIGTSLTVVQIVTKGRGSRRFFLFQVHKNGGTRVFDTRYCCGTNNGHGFLSEKE